MSIYKKSISGLAGKMESEAQATPKEKFRLIQGMISRDNSELNISWLCELVGILRIGYYNWLKLADKRASKEEQDKKDLELILLTYKYRGYDKGRQGIYFLHIGIRMNQ